MRVLVIGGTRFIGPRVVRPLVAAGHSVAVFHRGQCPGELPESVVHVHGEREALLEHREALLSFRPDVVVHMILGTAQDAWTARMAFDGAVEHFVLVSSVDVYRAYGLLRRTEAGEAQPVPIPTGGALRTRLYPYREGEVPGGVEREAMPAAARRRLEDYDKIPVEQILLGSERMHTTVLRLPMVLGPGDVQHRLHGYLKRMDDRREAILLGAAQSRWRTTRAYVDDVGLAIAQAALADRSTLPRVLNVGDPAALSEEDFVREVARIAGWEGRIAVVPDAQLPSHLHSEHDYRHDMVVDVHDALHALHLPSPIPLERALAETIAWERLHPPEPLDERAFDYAAEDAVLAIAR